MSDNEILRAASFPSDREKDILIYLVHTEQKFLKEVLGVGWEEDI